MEEEAMTAQPIEWPDDSRVLMLPKKIDAISAGLPADRSASFQDELRSAELGEPILDVMRAHWCEAMLNQVPGHAGHLEEALAGINLQPEPMLTTEEV
jgi:hypothetical protein